MIIQKSLAMVVIHLHNLATTFYLDVVFTVSMLMTL